MKALATLLALAALAAPALANDHTDNRCTAQAFRPFSAAVWDLDNWERGQPAERAIEAQRNRVACAPPAHRRAMQRRWRLDQRAYYLNRANMLYRMRVTPYFGCTSLGGCKWWALPAYIVDCESGGDYTPDAGLTFGGAYGLLVETWLQWGGGTYASAANLAAPRQQDRIAHQVWLDVGPSGWACA